MNGRLAETHLLAGKSDVLGDTENGAGTPSRYIRHSDTVRLTSDFPFCRATSTSTVRNR